MRPGVATEGAPGAGEPGATGRGGGNAPTLDDEDGGGGEHVLHAERFEVVKGSRCGRGRRERPWRPCRRPWTRVKVGLWTSSSLASAETGDDAFGESGFSRAEIAGEEDEDRKV